MKYEGQICRPPMERASFMLAISVGCAYNQCKFCNLFKHLKYRELPMEQIEELKRVKAANGNPKQVLFNAHIMTGIAGAGRGIENAEATAKFFNSTKPERITNFSLFLDRRTLLFQEFQKGTFCPADELENLEEEKRLLELLETDTLIYDGFHDYIEFRVRGVLPNDREKMLGRLNQAIEEMKKKERLLAIV